MFTSSFGTFMPLFLGRDFTTERTWWDGDRYRFVLCCLYVGSMQGSIYVVWTPRRKQVTLQLLWLLFGSEHHSRQYRQYIHTCCIGQIVDQTLCVLIVSWQSINSYIGVIRLRRRVALTLFFSFHTLDKYLYTWMYFRLRHDNNTGSTKCT